MAKKLKPKDAEAATRGIVSSAILAHLKTHGPRNWKELRDRYPQVTEATFYRWVKQVRVAHPEIDAGEVQTAAKLAAADSAERHIPAPVAPAVYVERGPKQVRREVNFVDALGKLYRQAEQIYVYATHEPKEGEDPDPDLRRIKNPVMVDISIKRRLDLIMSYVKVMDDIYNHKRQIEFYDIIVEEIAAESPETAHRIMVRLAALNARHGFTVHAGEPV